LRTHPRHPSPVSTSSELRDRCIIDIDLPLVLEVSSPVPSDKLDGDRAAAVAVGEDEPSGGAIRHKAWNKALASGSTTARGSSPRCISEATSAREGGLQAWRYEGGDGAVLQADDCFKWWR